ncbi:MAG TPA: hypothetical protein DIT61_10960 [Pseudomonas sp.]|nr:hypothetical protein [Pseudomonas sp.]
MNKIMFISVGPFKWQEVKQTSFPLIGGVIKTLIMLSDVAMSVTVIVEGFPNTRKTSKYR